MMLERSFRLGDLPLSSGERLSDAVLAYATVGELNAKGDNCIIIPGYYTGSHRSYEGLIGKGRALDPERYFIVLFNLFGNGLSTSPSHAPAGAGRGVFPLVSIADNVRSQHRVLTQALGVRQVRLAAGWSMGAMQSLWWATLYPNLIGNVLAVCGSASCWPLNQVFLDGVCAALRADPTVEDPSLAGRGRTGLKAFARVYAGWAYSAAFFREGLYRALGSATLEDLLLAWEEDHLAWSPGDLLAMAATWRAADIRLAGPGRSASEALSRITARTLFMPCDTDAYFTERECRLEAAEIPGAEVRALVSPYGHCAGAPGRFAAESALVEEAMGELLV